MVKAATFYPSMCYLSTESGDLINFYHAGEPLSISVNRLSAILHASNYICVVPTLIVLKILELIGADL